MYGFERRIGVELRSKTSYCCVRKKMRKKAGIEENILVFYIESLSGW